MSLPIAGQIMESERKVCMETHNWPPMTYHITGEIIEITTNFLFISTIKFTTVMQDPSDIFFFCYRTIPLEA